MFAGHRGAMPTTTPTSTDKTSAPQRRVRTDLCAGVVLLVTVIGGNLLWHASDAGIVAAFSGH
jgi:hypothetical protein